MSEKRSSQIKDIYQVLDDDEIDFEEKQKEEKSGERFSSTTSSVALFESDNVDEILRNKDYPIYRKCWKLFKICSIFKTNNGIFH
jgi:hypothetical protein